MVMNNEKDKKNETSDDDGNNAVVIRVQDVYTLVLYISSKYRRAQSVENLQPTKGICCSNFTTLLCSVHAVMFSGCTLPSYNYIQNEFLKFENTDE